MKKLTWKKLNLPLHPEVDEMMVLAYDVINLELKVNGKITKETKKTLMPAFKYLAMIEAQMKLKIDLVDIREL